MVNNRLCIGDVYILLSMFLAAILVAAIGMGCSQHSLQYMNALEYMEAGDYSSAEAELIRGIELSPNDVELHALLGTAYLKQEKYELAVDAYMEYAMIGSGIVIYTKGGSRGIRNVKGIKSKWKPEQNLASDVMYGSLKARYKLVNRYYAQGDIAQALKYQGVVVSALIDPLTEEWEAWKEGVTRFAVEIDQAQFLLQSADTLKQAGKLDEATRCYREILKRDPENRAAREGLEQIL
jgi:tetratricopeptide (TPR) repeat protein